MTKQTEYRRFRLTCAEMVNTLPVMITPHTSPRVTEDNPYLPRGWGASFNGLASKVDSVSWRHDMPVIPAASIKGSIRHLIAAAAVEDLENVRIQDYNRIAIGGVRQKKGSDGAENVPQSPNEAKAIKDANPIMALFGGSDPIFVKADIDSWSDAVPVEQFKLEDVAITRTDPMSRDWRAHKSIDAKSMDDLYASMTDSSGLAKSIKAEVTQLKKDIGKAADDDEREAIRTKLNAKNAELDELKKSGSVKVQVAQIQSSLRIPAGQTFSHEIRITTTLDRLGLLLAGLRGWGVSGGQIGSTQAGAGGGMLFDYRIEEYVGSLLDGDAGRRMIMEGVADEAWNLHGDVMQRAKAAIAK